MESQYKEFDRLRPWCLIAGLLASFVAGVLFTWSVLQAPLVERLGGTELKAVIVLSYTIQCVSSTLGSAVFGGFTSRLGERKTIILGALMLGLGYIASGFITSLALFFLVFGLVTGVGDAFIYPTYVGYLGKLYPEKRGLVSGLAAGALGGAAVIWSPVMAGLIEAGGLERALAVFGAAALLIVLPGALLVRPVPESYTLYRLSLSDSYANAGGRKISRSPELSRRETLGTATYYFTLIALICGLSSGNMCITQVSPIMQESFGLSATAAAGYASLMSLMSMLGRFIAGALSDRVDRLKIMAGLAAVPLVTMSVPAFCHGRLITVAAMSLTVLGYGGFGGALMPITAELFGTRHADENFSLLYVAFGFAGILGPQLAVRFSDGGDYSRAFLAAAAIALAGLVSALKAGAGSRAMKSAC